MRRAAGLGLMLWAAGAAAQTTVHYREGQRVDPRDVQQILSAAPTPTSTPAQGRTRSIRLLADEPVAQAAAAASAEPASALSLPVHFEFDSAAILPAAREQLDALAEGIKLLPQARRIIIEGHTDASGSEQYNDQLSQRRAEAVKRYLVQHTGSMPGACRPRGWASASPSSGSIRKHRISGVCSFMVAERRWLEPGPPPRPGPTGRTWPSTLFG